MIKNYKTSQMLKSINIVILLSITISAFLYYQYIDKTGWVLIGLVSLAVLSLIATIQTYLIRLTILETTVVLKTGFKTTVLSKEEIEGVHIAKGCSPIIQTINGRKIHLPTLNESPQSIANQIRNWLKKS